MTKRLASMVILLVSPLLLQAGEPEVRFGFYTETDGIVRLGRYLVRDDGVDMTITLAPYGRRPVELPVHSYERESGALELGWAGKPQRQCLLEGLGEDSFSGNCVEGEYVMPMAIRPRTRSDAEMMGRYFEVSQKDVAILDRAIRILTQQAQRNMSDERNCDDESAVGSVSLFCALYLASLEITGVYRHHRQAIKRVRMELVDRFPGDRNHLLQDVNDDTGVSDEALIAAVEAARAKIQYQLDRPQR